MKSSFGSVMVCAGVLFFGIGTLWRLIRWMKTEVPFSLTLFPLDKTIPGKMRSLAMETFFFRGLYREHPSFWALVWLFHFSLALILLGHVVGIYCNRQQFVFFGVTPEVSRQLSLAFGGIAGSVLLVSAAVLMIRRLSEPELLKLSPPEAYFDFVLILAVALSGMIMYLPGFHTNIEEVGAYMGEILHLAPAAFPDNPVFVIHFFLAIVLVAYLPFSRMFHVGGSLVIRKMFYENPPVYPSSAEKSRQVSSLLKRLCPVPEPGSRDKGASAR